MQDGTIQDGERQENVAHERNPLKGTQTQGNNGGNAFDVLDNELANLSTWPQFNSGGTYSVGSAPHPLKEANDLREHERAALRSQITELQDELTQSRTDVKWFSQQLRELQDELTQSRADVAFLAGEERTLQGKVAELTKTTQLQANRIRDLVTEQGAWERRNAYQYRTIERLSCVADERCQTIQQLREQVKGLNESLTTQHETILSLAQHRDHVTDLLSRTSWALASVILWVGEASGFDALQAELALAQRFAGDYPGIGERYAASALVIAEQLDQLYPGAATLRSRNGEDSGTEAEGSAEPDHVMKVHAVGYDENDLPAVDITIYALTEAGQGAAEQIIRDVFSPDEASGVVGFGEDADVTLLENDGEIVDVLVDDELTKAEVSREPQLVVTSRETTTLSTTDHATGHTVTSTQVKTVEQPW